MRGERHARVGCGDEQVVTQLVFEDVGTITLTLGTSSTSDGFAALAAWGFVRCNVTTLTGTGATVSVSMGT